MNRLRRVWCFLTGHRWDADYGDPWMSLHCDRCGWSP